MRNKLRVYADTSVFGGVFDEEFSDASKRFFEQIRMQYFTLVISAVVQDEIRPAPKEVNLFFDSMLEFVELIEVTPEALALRNAYLEAKIVSHKFSDDALHVALASVSECSLIVSWNFKHIVHFDKISMYNAVNTLQGFPKIAIFSPLEVIKYENEKI